MLESPAQQLLLPLGYRLLQQLGHGGCGEVWKAEAPGGLPKAIKFLRDNLEAIASSDQSSLELTALHRVKGIHHPFILTLDRIDVIDGQVAIVMELADQNLMDRLGLCRTHGLMGIPRPELLHYLHEAAEALDLINHEHGLQHCDIKPQNLFLVRNHCKVGDFGLARSHQEDIIPATVGLTPVYASPETFEGWISPFSDQYSLAVVYQELLTGKRPFAGISLYQLMMQHLTAAPDLSSLPWADQEIVGRALAKVPTDRFESCSAFIRALVQVADESVSLSSGATERSDDTIHLAVSATLRTTRINGAKGNQMQEQAMLPPAGQTAPEARGQSADGFRQGPRV